MEMSDSGSILAYRTKYERLSHQQVRETLQRALVAPKLTELTVALSRADTIRFGVEDETTRTQEWRLPSDAKLLRDCADLRSTLRALFILSCDNCARDRA
jgi:hypothetical protein